MKVLKNYKVLKTGGFDEYSAVEIRYDDTDVFAEMPICLVEFGQEFQEPVIIGFNQAGIASVVEKRVLIERLKETKKIYFELGSDGHPLVVKHQTNIYTRLPINDDENKYIYELRNGQIYVIEKQSTVEEVKQEVEEIEQEAE